MATTLSRYAFAGQKLSLINLKLVAMGAYAVGNAVAVGPVLGTITQLLPNNQVKLQVTGTSASGTLLLPKGTAFT